jgi:uncharacterized membrane protein
MTTSRIVLLDYLLAFAILIMIFANASPYCFFGVRIIPAIRIIFSIAAPIFIFLLGYTFALNNERRPNRNRQRMRSIQILSIAVIIDLIVWGTTPFYTFDVLYLIGFSSFFLSYIKKIKSLNYLATIIVIIFAIHIYLLNTINYRFVNNDIIVTNLESYKYFFANSLKRFVFDGWFPVFPWLAIALTGYITFYLKPTINYQKFYGAFSLFATIVFCLLFDFKNIQEPRNGYLEIFYPVSIALIFFILAINSAIALLLSVNFTHSKTQFKYLQIIGQYSLFVYLLHTIIISWVFKPICAFLTPGLIESTLLIISMICVILYIVVKLHTNIENIRNRKIYPILGFILGL